MVHIGFGRWLGGHVDPVAEIYQMLLLLSVETPADAVKETISLNITASSPADAVKETNTGISITVSAPTEP